MAETTSIAKKSDSSSEVHSARGRDLVASRVHAARVQTLFEHTPQVLIANGVNSLLIGVAVWNEESRTAVLAWWAAMAMMVVGRLLQNRSFRRDHNPSNSERWASRFTIASGISGMLWGLGTAALFPTGDIAAQVLLAFVIGGMGAGASSTIAAHRPAFVAFLLPSVAALTARFAWEGDDVHWVMAAMGVLFAALFFRIGTTTFNTLVESHRLRFSNEQLVEELFDARSELEENNATLERRVAEQTDARARVERQLHQTQKLEAVGRLTGGIAHDFNNHLTVIMQCLDLLNDPDTSTAEASSLRSSATMAARRGATLTHKLLAFSRRQPLTPVLLDVGATVEATVEAMIRRVMPETFRVHFENRAPGALAKVDHTQLDSALLNLAINARDAMQHGGNLWIEVDQDEERVRICVRDEGPGFDPDLIDRVLEPFFTTKGTDGTGLGLSMVHGFAAQSGGELRIEQNPGGGAAVHILLPLATAPVDVSVETIPQLDDTRMRDWSGRGERVLLVEDNANVRSATRKTLESLGYEVTVAPDVGVALTELDSRRVDLLLSDVMMPGGRGGLDLAEEAERRWPDLPILLVTGHTEEMDRLARYPVVVKPYTREQLGEQLRTLLD